MAKDTKPKTKVSSKNLRKLAQSFSTDSMNTTTSSSSSDYLTTQLEASMQQVTTRVPSNSTRSKIAKPKNSIESILPTMCKNEVMVFDVNGNMVIHSLMTRGGAWFLDVSDFDAMDKNCAFQYLAMRPNPQNNLILTRVPEIRHLIYVVFDEEGRPYPIQMREVAKANYLTTVKEEEEITGVHTKGYSLWESLSVTLRQSIMFNEGAHTNEGLQNNH